MIEYLIKLDVVSLSVYDSAPQTLRLVPCPMNQHLLWCPTQRHQIFLLIRSRKVQTHIMPRLAIQSTQSLHLPSLSVQYHNYTSFTFLRPCDIPSDESTKYFFEADTAMQVMPLLPKSV